MSNRLKKQELEQALGLVCLTAGDFLEKTSLKPHGGVASRAPYYAKATLERVLGRIANGEIEALYPVCLLAPQSPIQSAVLLHLMAACGKPVMKLNGWTVVSKDDWAELESGLQLLAAGSPDAGAPTCNKVLATLGRYCRPLKAHPDSVDHVIVTLAGQGFAIKPRLFVEACSIYPLNVGDFVGMGGEVAQACSSGQARPAVMANFEVTSDVAAPCRLSEDNQKAQKGAQRQASKPSIWNKFLETEKNKMIKFLYSFEYSSEPHIDGPIVKPGPIDGGVRNLIAQKAEFIFEGEGGSQLTASKSMICGGSDNLQVLARKVLIFERSFMETEIDEDYNLLFIDDGYLFASNMLIGQNGDILPDMSNRQRVEDVRDGDVVVVYLSEGKFFTICVPHYHIFNKIFRADNYCQFDDVRYHRGFEFNIHIQPDNVEALANYQSVEGCLKWACTSMAEEVLDLSDIFIDIEEIEAKYGGQTFCVTIVGRSKKWLSDLCFPKEAFIKHLAFAAGMHGSIPSVEIYGSIVV